MTCADIHSLIIEICGVIATVAAVVVAMIANHKATLSLNSSLAMQEQSKNVDLFDKRTDIIFDIEKNNETDEVKLQLLFNNASILAMYNELQELIAKEVCAEIDMKEYQGMLIKDDGEGGYIYPIEELNDLRHRAMDVEATSEIEQEYEAKCIEYQISKFDEVDGCWKVYNHQKLSDDIRRVQSDVSVCKQDLIDLMKAFIAESISSIPNGKKTR